MPIERIVAVGLLTQRQLDTFGCSLERVWPVDETPCFGGLIQAIDEADREVWRARDRQATGQVSEEEPPILLITPTPIT
jgi:hypothetical protein